MKPAYLQLNVGKAAHFVSSDGRLEVNVPAGALNPGDATADGGATSLLVRQIQAESGSNAGGSGHFSFGGFLIQVIDAHGQLAHHGLNLPVTMRLHYGNRSGALDLAHAYVLLNTGLPTDVNLDPASVLPVPSASPSAPQQSTSSAARVSIPSPSPTLGPVAVSHPNLDAANQTLSVSAPLTTPTMSASFGTNSPVAIFGKPQPFEVDLSGASLTYAYPIDVPAGPGGFRPPLSLVYNSAGVNDQHNPQGAAPWVGEGWNMSLGSISWAEHYVNENGGSARWQDSWELSDAFGTAATLVPPATNTATYLEDSGNPITPSPVRWHTAPETYAKVFSYRGTLSPLIGSTVSPPCFRVFLTSGVMEEFGCTVDSLQFYPASAGRAYISSWLLDLITEPNGNQIHISYQQDTEIGNGMSYPRDAVLSSVQWDSPTCINASVGCTSGGTAPNQWAPLMQVSFQATHVVAHVPSGYTPCSGGTGGLRCDDPVDLTGSGGLAAPTVQSDFVLNDMLVQVKDGTPAVWNTLRDYRLGYDQSGPGTIPNDPISYKPESTAGKLTLNQLTVFGDDNGVTALPVSNFTYSKQIEYYEDSTMCPASSTSGAGACPNPPNGQYINCGPSWNRGFNYYPRGCILWSQSYDGNSYYMSTASNGLGLSQSFSWVDLRDNMHGVDVSGGPNWNNSSDPLFCTNHQTATFPCDMADDETWSRIGLASRSNSLIRLTQAGQGGTQTSTPVVGTTSYLYQDVFPLAAQECPLTANGYPAQCVAGYSWGNQDDMDYLDFYNGKFMGFTQVQVNNPDGSADVHKFYSTEGWGVWTSDTTKLTVSCPISPPDVCHTDPWWDTADQAAHAGQSNAKHGHEYELNRCVDATKVDATHPCDNTNPTNLLQQVLTQYSATCPPAWLASGSPALPNYGNWAGNLVSPLDLGNPVAVCDIETTQVDNKMYDGSTSTSVPDATTTYTYETGTQPCASCYGRVVKVTTSSNNGSHNGSPTTIVKTAAYVWNDSVTPTSTSATGQYLISFPAFGDTEDATANRYQCSYASYDGQAVTTGQTNGLTIGLLTRTDRYTNCGNSGNGFTPSGQISTTATYDTFGNKVAGKDADANAGNSAHVGCTVGGSTYSSCTTYETTFDSLVTNQANALNQTSAINYQAPANATFDRGFGLWPVSTNDINNQTTSYTYDALGRQASVILPAETSTWTTQRSYTVWCSGTSAQSPCAEIDNTQRLNSTTTVTNRAFYDGMGHVVETRSPGPSGDVVQYYYYDPSQRPVFKSVPYLVTSYTGVPGSAAYSIPDSNQPGTSYTHDGLGRLWTTTDPLSGYSVFSYQIVCNDPGMNDPACYEMTLVYDPLMHLSANMVDSLGRVQYEQVTTGNSQATFALYATTKYTYDYVGELTQILHPDGTTRTTYQYDMAGRKTGMTDPDRGTESYSYDQDGNLTQSVDARGTAGTVFAGYDGLDRAIWRNTSNSPSGAYATYAYDSGTNGIGRLTSELFSGGGMYGGYNYAYDQRGHLTYSSLWEGVIGCAPTCSSYIHRATYDDAGSVLTEVYPGGETVTNSYGSQGWLSGVSTSQGNTTLLSGASYTGTGGASGFITSANLGGTTYQYSASFDLLARATDTKMKRTNDQTTLFDQARTFDAAGNVSTANTTLPSGTDNQAFCYDEQNRLTWAGSTGTPPCTGTAISAGTLTAAQYTQSLSYDTMGRLTNGPLGAYTYGNSAHVHAMTQAWPYTAAYDAAGDMTCRSPNSNFYVGCVGQQTGAPLTYNNEGQLSNWQDQPSSPNSTAAFLYDGQGSRVAQLSTQGGGMTTTAYIGGVEEVSTSNGTTTTTTYYYANGARIAMAVNGTFSYLASDGLGSANVTLNGSGTATASVLYAPYGSARYSSGTMPTDYGFTGQHADATSGLDYYGSRYYDPVAAQFTSADMLLPGGGFDLWGLSRYAYVEGNPVSRTDPTGQVQACECADDSSNTGNPQATGNSQPTGNPQPTGNSQSGGSQVVAWNPFTWNWSAAGNALGQGTSRYEGASADQVAQAVAGDIDLYAFGALGGLDHAMGGHLSESKFYKEGQDIGTPFAVANIALGGYGAVRGGYLLYRGLSAGRAAAEATDAGVGAGFNITNWSGYPASLPKPSGPFRLLTGDEYSTARAAANSANQAMRRAAGAELDGMQIHEIQPVKWGGSPTNPANKIAAPNNLHYEVTAWWNALQRSL